VDIDQLLGEDLETDISLSTETRARPASATAWSSSNITGRRDGLCEDGIEKVPFWSGELFLWRVQFSLIEAPFSRTVKPSKAYPHGGSRLRVPSRRFHGTLMFVELSV